MIRLVHLLRRRAGIELPEFQERWRDGHGPLVAARQTSSQILRYTQTHRLDDPANALIVGPRGQLEEPYDGVAEWWFDSLEAAEGALTGPGGQQLVADESEFVDLPRSPLWLAHDYPQFGTSLDHVVARPSGGIVKAHFFLRHRPELTLPAAQHYWHTVHGALARSMAPTLAMLRYVQVHRHPVPLEDERREARGVSAAPYTGHAEMWWDRMIPRTSPEAAAVRERAVEDERRFIDFPRSTMAIGKEFVFVDRW